MNKEINNEIIDLEHIILRLPNSISEQLSADLAKVADIEKILSIKFSKQYRECTVKYKSRKLKGVIVDLPNEVSSLKPLDNETVTNIKTIKHMIICEENNYNNEKSYNNDFIYNHGITAPLYNVNSTKYRKPKKKNTIQMMTIIRDMIMQDNDADSVWFQMTDEIDNEKTENKDLEYILNQCNLIEEEKLKLFQKNKILQDKTSNCDSRSDSDNDCDSDSDSDCESDSINFDSEDEDDDDGDDIDDNENNFDSDDNDFLDV